MNKDAQMTSGNHLEKQNKAENQNQSKLCENLTKEKREKEADS